MCFRGGALAGEGGRSKDGDRYTSGGGTGRGMREGTDKRVYPGLLYYEYLIATTLCLPYCRSNSTFPEMAAKNQ